MPYIYSSDAYSPTEIARKVNEVGVLKAKEKFTKTFILGTMAGGFIGMGGLFHTFFIADPELSWMTARALAGIAFASGYIIAILAGAEVFTSNNLLVMTFASKKMTFRQLLKNWGIVIVANAVGAIGLAVLFILSGLHTFADGQVGETAHAIGMAKAQLGFWETFSRAVLGNLFVCLAVWISLGGRSTADKVLGTILPLTALSALSLEHVVASFYFIPRTLLIEWFYPEYVKDGASGAIDSLILLKHLLIVSAGNIIGGSLMVGAAYYFVYHQD